MPEQEHDHAHYQCASCEKVYCTDEPRYTSMVEGDACPMCHVANVSRLPDTLPAAAEQFAESMAESMAEGLSGGLEAFSTQQSIDMRMRTLLTVAAQLFPFVSQDFTQEQMPMAYGTAITPSEGRRATAAVDIALLMEDQLLTKLRVQVKENKEQEQQP